MLQGQESGVLDENIIESKIMFDLESRTGDQCDRAADADLTPGNASKLHPLQQMIEASFHHQHHPAWRIKLMFKSTFY